MATAPPPSQHPSPCSPLTHLTRRASLRLQHQTVRPLSASALQCGAALKIAVTERTAAAAESHPPPQLQRKESNRTDKGLAPAANPIWRPNN